MPGNGAAASPPRDNKDGDNRAETPPEEKRLLGKFFAGLKANLKEVEDSVGIRVERSREKLEEKFEDRFEKLDDDFSALSENVKRHNELAVNTAREVKKLATDQEAFRSEVRDQQYKDQQTISAVRREISDIDTKVEEYRALQSREISDKYREMEKLLEQFKESNFGPNNKPGPREVFIMKRNYNMSNNAIGFYPIEPEDFDMIAMNHPGIAKMDMYRVATFDYLTLEMCFTPDWVKKLEEHYVSFIYDGVNTLYLVLDDLDKSGGRQIWQESPILREEGQRQTRELRHLEVPQFRARRKAMEDAASKYRYQFNDHHAKVGDNVKVRTRIVEHKDPSVYDYVLQHKFTNDQWGPTVYTTIPWPTGSEFPEIQWKVQNYIQHDIAKMRPARDRSTRPAGQVPKGRNRRATQSEEVQKRKANFEMAILDGAHQFVPGEVEPPRPESGEASDENREILRMRSRDHNRVIPNRVPDHQGTRLASSSSDSQSSITSTMSLSPEFRSRSKSICFPSKQDRCPLINVFAPNVIPQSVKYVKPADTSETDPSNDGAGASITGIGQEPKVNNEDMEIEEEAQPESDPDQGFELVAAPVILPQGYSYPPLPPPREILVHKVRSDARTYDHVVSDLEDIDGNGNQANNHGPQHGPDISPAQQQLLDELNDSLALPLHLDRLRQGNLNQPAPAPPASATSAASAASASTQPAPSTPATAEAPTQSAVISRSEEDPEMISALTPELEEEEEVFEDAHNKTAELIPPPGGLDDTVLSGSGVENELSSTDPGMSQSIMHRPSSTLAPNMVECDHTEVNETEQDSFLDPENKFELGEATLKEHAALAEAAALSRECRELNMSPPIRCSNPGQTSYPKFEESPCSITPAGALNKGKTVQKTLFGGVAVPLTGGKTPRTTAMRSRVKKATEASKENGERLLNQLRNIEKRKAHSMAPSTSKLSPPDKQQQKIEIVKEYDEEEVRNLQPDRQATPPPDVTGHIVSVLADTPGGKINSDPEASNASAMSSASAAETKGEQEKSEEK